jgi:hypothetical protein
MTPEVQAAIQEIAQTFPLCGLEAVEDGQGGAVVTLHEVPFEAPSLYQQANTWVGFQITHTYPYADVYPHFVRHDLGRRDGKPLGEGTSIGSFRNQPAVQISRRSNRHDPTTDTALLKLCKVLRWLNSRP